MDTSTAKKVVKMQDYRKPNFARYFKDNMLKAAVAIPLIVGTLFFGYVGITGTSKQLKDGSGVYRISAENCQSRVVLPSFLEVRENHRKMRKACDAAMDAFNVKNPRVVKTLESVYVVIAPESSKQKDVKGVHDAKEGKVYIYDTSDSANTRHEFLHAFLFRNASPDEERKIVESTNGIYGIFPEKFGAYLKSEYLAEGEDIVRVFGKMKARFGLEMEEIRDLAFAIGTWMPLYGFAEEKNSLGAPQLNYAALSEAFAYFGEGAIPEPLVDAYSGILSEKALKNVQPLSRQTIESAQAVFNAKIGPHL